MARPEGVDVVAQTQLAEWSLVAGGCQVGVRDTKEIFLLLFNLPSPGFLLSRFYETDDYKTSVISERVSANKEC